MVIVGSPERREEVGTLEPVKKVSGKCCAALPVLQGRFLRMTPYVVLLVLLFALPGGVPVAIAENPPTGAALAASQVGSSFDKDFADDFDSDFAGPNDQDEELIADPLINWNRGVFWVNDKLYFYLVKPVARGYRSVVPKPARSSVRNFFSNLAGPIRAGNSLLQFRFYDFGTEIYRFILNSTFGIGGLFDPVEEWCGIRKKENDFGLTLAYYGVGHGFYLVLPVVGPSSLRDATGSVVDTLFDPLQYADLGTGEYLLLQTYKTVNWLSMDPDTYEGVIRDAIDPYLFIRAAYAQRRMALVGHSEYTIDMLNIFDGTDFDFDIVNPLRW
jgi:phospholipid-binding lipoprotein MlaA